MPCSLLDFEEQGYSRVTSVEQEGSNNAVDKKTKSSKLGFLA
jgi:hypothetical protein